MNITTEIKKFNLEDLPIEVNQKLNALEDYDTRFTCYLRWCLELQSYRGYAEVEINATSCEGYLEFYDLDDNYIERIDLSKLKLTINVESTKITDSIRPISVDVYKDELIINFA